jgi:DNA modification methylase
MKMKSQVIQGDCLEVMKTFDDECIDLTVTSPPYDNLRDYKGYAFDFEGIAKELYRVTKQGGVVVWVVGDATIKGSETGTSFKQALYFKECGFNLHDTMIYQKDNPPPVGGSNRYFQHFEYMFILSKGKPAAFNPIDSERRNKWGDKRTERTKAFTRDKHGDFIKKKVSLTGRVKIGNIWKYVVGGGNSVEYGGNHPAAFPEKLAEDHILSWSNEGDTVLDPMAGRGTTLKMAKKNNRNYIGIEISQEYIEIIEKRLEGDRKI